MLIADRRQKTLKQRYVSLIAVGHSNHYIKALSLAGIVLVGVCMFLVMNKDPWSQLKVAQYEGLVTKHKNAALYWRSQQITTEYLSWLRYMRLLRRAGTVTGNLIDFEKRIHRCREWYPDRTTPQVWFTNDKEKCR